MARRNRQQAETQVETQVETPVVEDSVVATEQAIADENVVVETAETPAVVAEAEAVAAEAEATHCRLCNRLLTADVSVERGLGPVCAGHVKRILGRDSLGKAGAEGAASEAEIDEAVAKAKEAAGGTIAPDDFNAEENVHPAYPEKGPIKFVKLAAVHIALAKEGRSIGAFVKAFGGDRGLLEPKSWVWNPVYVGRVRYLPAEVLNHLADIPLVRERKAKVEGETPPTAPAAETAIADEDVAEEEDTEA